MNRLLELCPTWIHKLIYYFTGYRMLSRRCGCGCGCLFYRWVNDEEFAALPDKSSN